MNAFNISVTVVEPHPLSGPIVDRLDRSQRIHLLAVLDLNFPTVFNRPWADLRVLCEILIVLKHVFEYLILLVKREFLN